MRFRLSSWTANHLLAAWSAYWAALVVWVLGQALPSIWTVSRPEAKGSGSVSYGDGRFEATVTNGGITTWHGSVSLQTLLLVTTVPPLVLWAFWLFAQRKTHRTAPELLGASPETDVSGATRNAESVRRTDAR